MSVQTQIERIKANIANAYAKAQEKGAALPAVQNSENLPAAIEVIPTVPEGLRTITVTAEPPEGGEVSGGGMVSDGMEVTVSAANGYEYKFKEWKENNAVASYDAEYKFRVENDRNLVALFEKPVSRLPEGYTELEYIDTGASGSENTARINTGLPTNVTFKIVMDVLPLEFSADSYPGISLAYSYATYSSKAYGYIMRFANNSLYPKGLSTQYYAGGSDITASVSTDLTFRRMLLDWDYPNGIFKINNEIVLENMKHVTNNLYSPNMCIAGNKNGVKGQFRLYSFKYYENNEILSDMVPCKDPSGVIGMYDIIRNSFYKSEDSSAPFIAGPPV